MNPFDTFAADFINQKVLVLGLGLLGSSIGLTKCLASVGAKLRVADLKSATDLAPSLKKLAGFNIDYIFGPHRLDDVDWADIVVRGAAVPWQHPLLNRARAQHKPIVMDAQLFAAYAAGVTLIGVTGTRGKTTTTHLIYELLKKVPRHRVLLGGNVKDVATTPLLRKIQHPSLTIAVLELSSWQLQAFASHRLSPHHAVLTNVYPDHLNSYPSLQAYYHDKQAIYKFQTEADYCYLNRSTPVFHRWSKAIPSRIVWYSGSDLPATIDLSLLGDHNRQNAAAAMAVAHKFHLSKNTIYSIVQSFKPLTHRLQVVRFLNHLTYINDTTSTTPIATVTALNTVTQPVTLIAGGSDKRLPLGQLIKAVNQKATRVILLTGSGTDRLKPHLDPGKIAGNTESLRHALALARSVSVPGSTILFSPGFASFGLFKNEYDRGEQFINLVNNL